MGMSKILRLLSRRASGSGTGCVSLAGPTCRRFCPSRRLFSANWWHQCSVYCREYSWNCIAFHVKSSICSERTKHFWYKCHGLFVNCDDYCEKLLKISFNYTITLHLFKSLSRIKAHYSHVSYTYYQNMPQNLFASC